VLCHACYQRYGDTGRLERKVKLKARTTESSCTNKHCTGPKDGKELQKIDDTLVTNNGPHWGKLLGESLCSRCFETMRLHGSLEPQIVGKVSLPTQRCSFEGCKRPNKSSAFFQIPQEYSVGGWDWKPLVGNTLCRACHSRFSKVGKLDREPETAVLEMAAVEGQGGVAGDKPADAIIEALTGKRKGPEDVGGEAKKRKVGENGQEGEVMTEGGENAPAEEPTDYSDYSDSEGPSSSTGLKDGLPGSDGVKQRGKSINELPPEEKVCCYDKCKNPKESRKFYLISADMKSGGRDWTPLASKVLCNACHSQYRIHGSLERDYTHKKPHDPKRSHIPDDEKVCCYDKCLTPRESKKFYKIEGDCNAGGHDWGSLVSKVVCYNCYTHFRQTGTLERKLARIHDDEEKRCCYDKCQKPTGGKRFHKIDNNCQAGGQNWSALIGKVLCKTCYTHFSQNGTLERKHIRIVNDEDKKCFYDKCQNPTANQRFHKIDRNCHAGNQDWKNLVGRILCKTCYTHFRKTGSLERKRVGREGDEGNNASKVLERSAKKAKTSNESGDEESAAEDGPRLAQVRTAAELDALVSSRAHITASVVPHGSSLLNAGTIEVRDSDVVATLVGGIKSVSASEQHITTLGTGALELRHGEVVATLVGGIKALTSAEQQALNLRTNNEMERRGSEAVATLATLMRGHGTEGALQAQPGIILQAQADTSVMQGGIQVAKKQGDIVQSTPVSSVQLLKPGESSSHVKVAESVPVSADKNAPVKRVGEQEIEKQPEGGDAQQKDQLGGEPRP
jgi:hypothetical protein